MTARLTDVSAAASKVSLHQMTLELGAGTMALLGGPADGVGLALAVLAGAVVPSRGSVRVLGGDPRVPSVRRAIGWVPREPALPEALSVRDALTLTSRVRGAPIDPEAALATFGLEGLATTRVERLSRPQLRAVALAEAVACKVVRVLLIDEPFVDMEPSSCAAMRAALAADPSRCVVFSTSSPADARELAQSHAVVSSGRLLRVGTSNEALAVGQRARVVAIVEDPRELARALALEPELTSLEVRGRLVAVTAADVDSASRAMQRAVIACGAAVDVLEVEGA